ncbi:MAG TPA: hypothetical protein VLE19_14845 [Pyrinomonadaceae bacterium]|nr:hypothetical protein [Pyrinomonadaceae bacterium]
MFRRSGNDGPELPTTLNDHRGDFFNAATTICHAISSICIPNLVITNAASDSFIRH